MSAVKESNRSSSRTAAERGTQTVTCSGLLYAAPGTYSGPPRSMGGRNAVFFKFFV